jgi:oligopeptide transport system ATP-binding protein
MISDIPQKDYLLQVKNLAVDFRTEGGIVRGVRDVSFDIYSGETVALVGESACGKSVSSLSVMRLLPKNISRIANGEIRWRGRDGKIHELVKVSEKQMRRFRGNEIAMIFQEPMTSLNPVYSVGDQIAEAITLHTKKSRNEALDMAEDILLNVGIPEPKKRLSNYPHELSGGMRQRVMIAMALSCNPSLLIADEPTTALDVTIQAQILDLIKELQEKRNMSVLFITHDLGVVAEVAKRVIVMYAGQVVESADTRITMKKPMHPYTKGLLASLPRLSQELDESERLKVIPGNVPDAAFPPPACSFHPRCSYMESGRCDTISPAIEWSGNDHQVRCLRWSEILENENADQ